MDIKTGKIVRVILILLMTALPSLSADADEVFTITNGTGFVIAALYVSDVDSESWGTDLLNANPLLDGESIRIPLLKLESLHVNIKARDDEGDTYTVIGINAETEDVRITLNDIDPD